MRQLTLILKNIYLIVKNSVRLLLSNGTQSRAYISLHKSSQKFIYSNRPTQREIKAIRFMNLKAAFWQLPPPLIAS
jgi:hypothetical protein